MKKKISILAALLLLGMLFTACGENGLTDPTLSNPTDVNFNLVVNDAAPTRALVNLGTLVTSGMIKLTRGTLVKYIGVSISGTTATAAATALLAGDWTAQVQLYDADGTVIYSATANFVIGNGYTTQNVTITLQRHQGNVLFTFTLPTETVNIPNLILWNKLESISSITNSTYGPALIPGTGMTFATGKWGNGINCGASTVKANTVRIPAGTIPMSDFSIEFWYTKTSDYAENDRGQLLFTSEPDTSYTNNISLSIMAPWKPAMLGTQFGTYYCILFGVRINNINEKEVYLMYDFGSLAALNNAFPLDTPVHIAVTKRNSDGKLRIFLNGVQIPAMYTTFNEPFFTSDTSNIANKSGFFPYETFVGNYSTLSAMEYPAKGTIDNLKVYNTALGSFFTDTE